MNPILQPEKMASAESFPRSTPARSPRALSLAVDASNIRAGGGVTHLLELLTAYEPNEGIRKMVVFGAGRTVGKIPSRPWLEARVVDDLERGPMHTAWWRHLHFTREVQKFADILVVLGGIYTGSFHPYVCLAQNLLPFDRAARSSEGYSAKRLRLHMLTWLQGRSFRHADGVVFMTEISRQQIVQHLGLNPRRSVVVHHGASPRFASAPADAQPVTFSKERPFRLLYVSIIEPYKHQDVVVRAAGQLLGEGRPVELDLVGPASDADRARLLRCIATTGRGNAIRYHGPVPYDELHPVYANADAFIFASSCETFGIILLEAMGAGLPLICSHRSAMPEVAGDAAIYFDPLNERSLAEVVGRLMDEPGLRRSLAFRSRRRVHDFSWRKCAEQTFGFVSEVWRETKGAQG